KGGNVRLYCAFGQDIFEFGLRSPLAQERQGERRPGTDSRLLVILASCADLFADLPFEHVREKRLDLGILGAAQPPHHEVLVAIPTIGQGYFSKTDVPFRLCLARNLVAESVREEKPGRPEQPGAIVL